MSIVNSYKEVVEESLKAVVPLFENYFKINTGDSIANTIAYPLGSGKSYETSVSIFIDKKRPLLISQNGTPYTDHEFIFFPAKFASETYCKEYFEVSVDEARKLKWLLAFYAIFHEGLHIRHSELDDKYFETLQRENDLETLVDNFVSDIFIEELLVRKSAYANTVTQFARNIFFHPYIMQRQYGKEFNPNHIHTLRSCDWDLVKYEYPLLVEVRDIVDEMLEVCREDPIQSFHKICKSVVKKIVDLLSKDDESLKGQKKEPERQSRFNKSKSKSSPKSDISQKQWDIIRSVKNSSSRKIEKEMEKFQIDLNSSNSGAKASHNKTPYKVKIPKLREYGWVDRYIRDFYTLKKSKQFTQHYQDSGVLNTSVPVSAMTGNGFLVRKSSGKRKKKPEFLMALDHSISMNGDLIERTQAFAFQVQKSLAKRNFPVATYSFGIEAQLEILEISSSMFVTHNGRKSPKRPPEPSVYKRYSLGGATPINHMLDAAGKIFSKGNNDKILLLLTDGKGNVTIESGASPKDEALKLVDRLEKNGITVVFGALTTGVLSHIRTTYGKERALDFSSEEKFKEGLQNMLSRVTSFK